MEPMSKEAASPPFHGFEYGSDHTKEGNLNLAKRTDTTEEKPLNKRKQWKAAWYDFSQSTTLHGINKIAEDTPYTIRRLLWVCIVLLGIALFTNQLVQSVIYYLSYPVTVNVKINYNTTLTFPAVTVCNQNNFRMTATAERGKYHLVEEYYWKLGSDERVDLSLNNATNISIETLHYEAAHRKDDLIVSCTWDEMPCDMEKIYRELTDYGVCYTFNTARYGDVTHNISRTGADRGLRLNINIEQYEYMVGPNPGAGIKLLIHENTEIPLVRDLGLAIPPGTHAYVGVQIIEVANLGTPHGQCNNSASLDFYKYYSMTACMVECKEKYLIKKCGCRDAYMQAGPDGNPPVCTMEQYQDCAVWAMEHFYEEEDRCVCPIPCRRLLYDSTITYAYSSSLDTERFRRNKNSTKQLQQRYIAAREVQQRVNTMQVEEDKKRASLFDEAVSLLDGILTSISDELGALREWASDEMINRMSHRLRFHKRWGLDKLKYVAQNNFVRGWNLMKERTFDLVASSHIEIAGYLEETFEQANNLTVEETALRLALYATAQKELSMKKILCTRALDNITKVMNAYEEVEPILLYKASPGRRYDRSWVSRLAVQASPYLDAGYFESFTSRINELLNATIEIEKINMQMKNGELVNLTTYRQWRVKFEKSARSYNYYSYMLDSRVINTPVEYCDQLAEKFLAHNESLWSAYANFLKSMTRMTDFVGDATQAWKDVIDFRDELLGYVTNPRKMKTRLAEIITSKSMDRNIETLQMFFTKVRSLLSAVSGELASFEDAYSAIWRNMLGQRELEAFYQMIHDDVTNMSNSNSSLESDHLEKKFAYMINKSKEWILDNLDLMDIHMNADFAVTSLVDKSDEIREVFRRAGQQLNVHDFGVHAERFVSRFESWRGLLEQFLLENEIDDQFYRNNFMSVDIFMKELSYEQIQQQRAYDMTGLWSDIGGSMGLFIGASVITAFEIIDVIIHNVMRLHCSV